MRSDGSYSGTMGAGARGGDLPPREPRRSLVADLLGIELAEKHEIYHAIAASTSLRDGTFWLEILLSAGIATLGLILNSPAVIIGAMLISPLMGPILANGLALAAGDLVLALRALVTLLISAIVAVGFATLLVVLLPFREMTAEILARTRPNTLDLVIALFSGAVGSIAICKQVRGVATSIPGVAIAVALMPPLCVVGYGVGLILTLDREQGEAVVRGGGLLFLTNLVAITLTAMVVFLVFEIGNAEVRERVRLMRGEAVPGLLGRLPLPKAISRIGSLPGRLLLVAVLVAMLVVPLSRSLDSLKKEIGQRHTENSVQKRITQLWHESFSRRPDGEVRSYIDTISASESDDHHLSLHMRIFTSRAYTAEERNDFIRRLGLRLSRKPESIALSLVEIPTSSYEVAARIKPDEVPSAPVPTLGNSVHDVRQEVEKAMNSLRLPQPALLDQQTIVIGPSEVRVDVTYLSEREIDPDGQVLVRERLLEALDDPSIVVVLHRAPSSIPIGFNRRQVTPSESTADSIRGIAGVALRHPGWRLVLRSPGSDPKEAARTSSIRTLLAAAGVEATRVSPASAAGALYEVSVDPSTGQP